MSKKIREFESRKNDLSHTRELLQYPQIIFLGTKFTGQGWVCGSAV